MRFQPGRLNPKFGTRKAAELVDEEGIIERRCVKCGRWLVLELFCKAPDCFRGRTCECKFCQKARRKRSGNW